MKRSVQVFFLFSITAVFSQESITKIPKEAVCHFYELTIGNFNIRYPEKTSFPNKYKNYYAPNISKPIFHPKRFSEKSIDTLKHYIKLEIVNDIKKYTKIKNPYDLDKTTSKVKFYKNGSFDLPIKKGNKKKHIQSEKSIEAYIEYFNYVGEINAINKYVIKSFFETLTHFFIDKNSGERTEIGTGGFPHFSPDKKILVDLFPNTATYQHNESAELTIVHLKNKGKSNKPILRVNFKSWMPSEEPSHFFWISNSELIFRAYPVRKYIKEGDPKKLEFQYLKLTIKNKES